MKEQKIMLGKKKNGSVIEPKAGDKYITMNKGLGGEYKVKVLTRQPKGWTPIKGAMTAPRGYIWVSNNKSIFKGERQTALIRDKSYPESWETEPVKIMPSTATKSTKQSPKAVEEKSTTTLIPKVAKADELRKSAQKAGSKATQILKQFKEEMKTANTKEQKVAVRSKYAQKRQDSELAAKQAFSEYDAYLAKEFGIHNAFIETNEAYVSTDKGFIAWLQAKFSKKKKK